MDKYCSNCDRLDCKLEVMEEAQIEAKYRYDRGEDKWGADWQKAHLDYLKEKLRCSRRSVDWRARSLELEQLLRLSLEIMDTHLPLTGYGYPDEELRPRIVQALDLISRYRK